MKEEGLNILQEIFDSLIQGQTPRVKELTEQALEEEVGVGQVLNQGLIAGMAVIGERFERREIFLPDVLLAARAMYAGLDILEPLLAGSHIKPVGRVILGTVQGDIHDIGKNLVGIMMRGAGFEVVDLGVDVSPQKFVETAGQGISLIGMSALVGATMPSMQRTIEALQEAGLRDRVKTIVGGAIVTQTFADRIGADGYAPDAASAAHKAKELLGLG
jgi:5-methyltetrahydrofolate--homocysteine methyltransferase